MSKDSFENAAGKARSAVENIKDAISSGADAAASVDYSALRDDISKTEPDRLGPGAEADIGSAGSGDGRGRLGGR
jgi:hypothetical protein